MWGDLAAALGSGFFSARNNERNLKYQREANLQNIALQREINDKNIAFAKWATEYNNPKNQVSMWRDAGINPLLMVGGISGGSKAITPELGTAKVEAPVSDMNSSIANVLNVFASMQQWKKSEAETTGLNIQNSYAAQQIEADIAKKNADTNFTRNQTAINLENLKLAHEAMTLKKSTVANELALGASALKLQAQQIENEGIKGRLLGLEEKILAVQQKYAGANARTDLRNKQIQTTKLIEEINLLKKSVTDKQLQATLSGIEISLALQTYESNKEFIEARAWNEHYLKRGKVAVDAIGNIIPTKAINKVAEKAIDKFSKK